MGASLVSAGKMVDYTPGSAVTAGAVVVQGDLVGVANLDIPAGKLGAITVVGVFDVTKGSETHSVGDLLYWDVADGQATSDSDSGTNKYIGKAISAAASGDSTIRVAWGIAQSATTVYSPMGNAIADPGDAGAIPVTDGGSVSLVTEGAETRTLAAPTFVGQELALTLKTDGGDCVITASAAVNQTGNTTLTGADAGDNVVLVGVELGAAKVWRIVCNDGWALSTP
jgi:predicted RecA/RadA family phage recombinase